MINIFVLNYGKQYVRDDVSTGPVERGMILGASVKKDGTLSPALQWRVDIALSLYEQGGFDKFFVSGNDSEEYYQEVQSIVEYLLKSGVSSSVIVQDPWGFDTYDSMWRAQEVFGLGEVIIFTQAYHLPRALYIARRLWLTAWGAAPPQQISDDAEKAYLREMLARVKAVLDVEVLHSAPKWSE